MSSRAIRRLERKKLLDLGSPPKKVLDSEEEEGGDEDEEIVKDQPVKSFNAFAFLGNDDDEDGDEDRTEEEKDNEDEEIKKENIVKIAAAPGKSKKNKKKTKKAQNVELNDDELDKFLEQVKQKDKKLMSQSNSRDITPIGEDLLEEEDLEWEFDQEDQIDDFDSNFKFFTTSRLKESLSILSIETIKHLDADNEFQNLFGKLSIDTIEDANTTTSLAISPDVLQQFKRLARLTRGWSGKDRRGVPGTTRKLLFTKIRDDWLPTAQKPLNMDEIEGDNLIEYFLYKEDDPLLGYEFFKINYHTKRNWGLNILSFKS